MIESPTHAEAPAADPGSASPPRRGHGWRSTATLVVLVLLGWGTVRGSDHDFPFGPMSQYSNSTKPNSTIWIAHVYGSFTDGTERRLGPGEVGMRIAEFDGQVPRFRADPTLLLPLVQTYETTFARRVPELLRLRVQEDGIVLRGRKVVGRRQRVIASVWAQTDGAYAIVNLYGRFADGTTKKLSINNVGMTVAAFARAAAGPGGRTALLHKLALAYQRSAAGHRGPPLVAIMLRSDGVVLRARQVVSRSSRTVAEVRV